MYMRFIVTIIIFTGISPLLVLGDCNLIEIPNGRSSFRMKGRAISFTCNDGFVLYGESYDTCRNGFWSRPPPRCVAPGCPLIQNITNGDVIRSHTGSVIEVTCHNGMTIQGEALLTCDGRNWSSSIPKCLEPSEVDSCDFESSQFCGWSQDQTDDFDWTHHSGQTSTGRTGPNTDHTLGPNYTTGHYIYMEASTPRHPGDVARLLSPWYPSDRSNRCFRFWYHMNGPNQLNAVGTLKVLLRTGSGKKFSEKILFTMSGNQGEDWKCGHFKIPICSERFQIVLEAIRQDSYASDIAVDDWLMLPCKPPDLSLPDPAAQSARQSTISEGISSVSSRDTTEGVDISTGMFTTPSTVKNTTETFTKDDTPTIMTTAENSVNITITYDSSTTSEQSYHTELYKTPEDNYTSSTSLSALSDHSSTEILSRKSSFASRSIATTAPEAPSSSSTNKLTKPPEISQTDRYSNFTNNESNTNTFSKEPSSTTRRSLLHNSTHKNHHLIVFTAEAIVNMCIGLVVLCLFTVILVIMECICRRQQKIYNDKYQELKLFVETHYRTKYITV
ncbi:MAM and LDL-receptor class A domain-containing protein 2-like [Saccostrea cucullata]|uniref:MAM and LDL-receptor class A domain-containing protein 2-like n=1 Tax=Saccostrea cuccullata TaxID=36930 RepID=UPI002ECFD23D